MADWLYEDGIGEERVIRLDNGRIVEAWARRPRALGLGAVIDMKVARVLGGGRAELSDGEGRFAMLPALGKAASEGAKVRVEIVREAIAETGLDTPRTKWPRARLVSRDTPERPAPTLSEEIQAQGDTVETCFPGGPDRFAEAGWADLVEEAASGRVAFASGELLIAPTPAMTVIDVDGAPPPRGLAIAAATAAAQAISRLGITGAIVIDFPTLESRADRTAIADAFDAAACFDCERTAVNGFGLMQIIRRRARPSLVELWQGDPETAALIDLLRRAEREPGPGPVTLHLPARLRERMRARGWEAMLARRSGRAVAYRIEHTLEPAQYGLS